MRRRDFLKGLAGVLAAASAPTALLSSLPDRQKWKSVRRESGIVEVRINPEWVNAPYEIGFYVANTPEEVFRPTHVVPIMLAREVVHDDKLVDKDGNELPFRRVSMAWPPRQDASGDIVFPFIQTIRSPGFW